MTTDKVITECHNWENQEIITYARLGECNSCGACCQRDIDFGSIIQRYYQNDTRPTPRDGLPTIGNQGSWGTLAGERRFFLFVDTIDKGEGCAHYVDGKGCGIHDTKPRCCVVFPLVPEDIRHMPNCSYTFKEISRRNMNENDDYSMPDFMKDQNNE